MEHIPAVPALVTVCRSMRDGYVTRQHWPQIESGVMNLLKRVAQRLDVGVDLQALR